MDGIVHTNQSRVDTTFTYQRRKHPLAIWKRARDWQYETAWVREIFLGFGLGSSSSTSATISGSTSMDESSNPSLTRLRTNRAFSFAVVDKVNVSTRFLFYSFFFQFLWVGKSAGLGVALNFKFLWGT
jgi:hypothetical protein